MAESVQVSPRDFVIPKILINGAEVLSTTSDMDSSYNEIERESKVVISGASCRLPESENMEEFWHNLSTSTDMVTTDDRRWKPGLYGLPERNGKLKDLVHFDANFFRVKPFQAQAMDPQLRLLLEVTQEAIIDAGYNPSELRGSQTSVFVGCMMAEAYEAAGSVTAGSRHGHGFNGANDAMIPNSVSYYFDFKGPSLSINTACSSSLTCLDLAVQTIISGQCQYAIAAGINVLLKPGSSLHMLKLGALSPDGTCKSFDASANGYVRSEGIVAVFLSAKELARRNYAHILNSLSCHDGYKPQAISYPNGEEQMRLVRETLSKINLHPQDVYYLEAHGTGTAAGDYEECKALDRVFFGDGARKQPLYIGSVKSNMGHSEPTSGLAGVVKLLLSFRQGVIPPNLHLKVPNPRITSIIENRLSVVTQPTPMPADAIVGINSFGFGGATSHAVLKGGGRTKRDDEGTLEKVTLAFPVSSCTETGLSRLMDFVEANHTDKALLTLIASSMTNTDVDCYPHRGYLLWKEGECSRVVADDIEDSYTEDVSSSKPPVWFVFSGVGSQWSEMGRELLQYPVFASTLQRCYDALPSTVANLITSPSLSSSDPSMAFVDNVVAICAVSIAQYELLRAVGVEPDHLVGHSLGETIVSYADGALTLEQCMLVAYWRAMCTVTADVPAGAMAAVGLPWSQVAARCPEGVWLACNNAKDNVTISGFKDKVKEFVAILEEEKVIARMVNSADIPSHSPLIAPAFGPETLEILRGIIPSPKAPSKKWVITSVPEDKQENLLCSAEFHVQGAMSPVFFYEAIRKIPQNAIVIEFGPHALLHAPIKRTVQPGTVMIQLQNRKLKNQDVVLMNALGSCYNAGLNVNTLALVEPVKLPVGPQTPSIGHLMSWEHSEEWFVPQVEEFISTSHTDKLVLTKSITINPKRPVMFEDVDISGYRINGEATIPPSFYLGLVWQLLAESRHTVPSKCPVRFSHVEFHCRLSFLEYCNHPHNLSANILARSGQFEVCYVDLSLVTGTISSLTESTTSSKDCKCVREEDALIVIKSEDIYKEMAIYGYDLDEPFRVLSHSSDLNLGNCVLKQFTNMNTSLVIMLYVEAAFQIACLSLFECDGHDVYSSISFPGEISTLEIHPQKFTSTAEKSVSFDTTSSLDYKVDTSDHCIHIEFSLDGIPRSFLDLVPYIAPQEFRPYFKENPGSWDTLMDGISKMLEIVAENVEKKEFHLIQVAKDWSTEERKLVSKLRKEVREFFRAKIHHSMILIGTDPSKPIPTETLGKMENCDLIVSLNSKPIPSLMSKLANKGFVLVKDTTLVDGETSEDKMFKCKPRKFGECNMRCVATRAYRVSDEEKGSIILYRHSPEEEKTEEHAIVLIQSSNYHWITELKELLKKKDGPKRIYCISEHDPNKPTGLLGMINCLKQEGYGQRLRCVYLADISWREFQKRPIWEDIKLTDHMVNIVKGGVYGSFAYDEPLRLIETPEEEPGYGCDSNKAYIITGGLGGFGLELAHLLAQFGAEYLILTSRSGVQNGYQRRRLEWMRQNRAVVEVSKLDVSFEDQALDLVRLALQRKPCCAVFHLAVVLEDRLFENQTEESFKKVMAPKSDGAVNLDKALRTLSTEYPELKESHFFCFSSVSSAFGIAGQTNYAYANSVMDRVCEQRVEDGLHGLSIQWGAIADVGVLEKSLKERNLNMKNISNLGNTRPQPIGSCLYALKTILLLEQPVVCCCIPDYKFDSEEPLFDSDCEGSSVTTTDGAFKAKLYSILGIRNPTKVKLEASMNQLGLDSITSAEVQTLFREFGVSLEAQELSEITFGNLIKKVSGETTTIASDITATVCRVLGIRNAARVNLDAPLSELGLDSLSAAELCNSLEEKNSIIVTTQDLPQMSIADLAKLTTSKESSSHLSDIQLSICRLLGIRNTKRVKVDTPLSELGMDSLTASEVYNLLERDFKITSVSQSELPKMSLAGLGERVGESEIQKSVSTGSVDSGIVTV